MNFRIESLGVVKSTVYDLGVDTSETFFVKGKTTDDTYILAHNSNYINVQPLIDKKFNSDDNSIEVAEWVYQLFNNHVMGYIDTSYKELASYCNAKVQAMNMDMEKINSSMVFTSKKKRYAYLKRYDEGTWYRDKPKLSVTGLQSIQSKVPKFARTLFDETYEYVLSSDNYAGLIRLINDQYKRFHQIDIDELAEVASINGGFNIIKQLGDKSFPKGLRAEVKAVHVHNLYNASNNYRIKPITQPSKVKILPLKSNNTVSRYGDRIAYVGNFPNQWRRDRLELQIDKDAIWEKVYKRVIDSFLSDIIWDSRKPSLDLF